MCCVIKDLDEILTQINNERAKKGLKVIQTKDWSSFLSGASENKVRQHWITQIRAGKCISRDRAVTLLASLNSVLKSLKLNMLSIDVIICDL